MSEIIEESPGLVMVPFGDGTAYVYRGDKRVNSELTVTFTEDGKTKTMYLTMRIEDIDADSIYEAIVNAYEAGKYDG